MQDRCNEEPVDILRGDNDKGWPDGEFTRGLVNVAPALPMAQKISRTITVQKLRHLV